MAKYYKINKYSAILYYLGKNNYTKADLCRFLGISQITLNTWIEDPYMINLRQLSRMAGLFGLSIEELVYCLLRNKPQVNKAGDWYLEDMRLRVSSYIGEIDKEN